MSLAIAINGTAVYGAGAYNPPPTVIPAVSVDPASLGIVQLVGEANGGAPGLTILDNPTQCKSVFGGGALANAALLAFNPAQNPASPDGANDIPGGAFRVQCYKVNQSTRATLNMPMAAVGGYDHITIAGSTTTTIKYGPSEFTASALIGMWLLIGSEKRRVVSNTATDVVVSAPYSVAPPITTTTTVLATSMILTSENYGLDTNQIAVEWEASATARKYILTVSQGDTVESSPAICGDPVLRVMYLGGTVATGGTGAITAATSTLITYDSAVTVAANAMVGMVIQLPNGLQRQIASNAGHVGALPEVVTLVTPHAMTAAQAAACVGGTATVRTTTTASVHVGDLTFSASTTLAGDTITLTYATLGITTLRQLVNYVNANTNFLAVIADGVNPDTTLLADMDWGQYQYSNNDAVDCRFDFDVEDAEISSAATSATSAATGAGPYALTSSWTIITTTDIGPATATFTTAVAASVLGVAAAFGDFTGTTGLSFVVNGGAAQAMNLTAAVLTVDDVVAQINAAGITGVFAANVGGQVKVTTDLRGTAATVTISGTGYVKAFGAAPTVTAGVGNVQVIGATTATEVATIIDAACVAAAVGASCSLVGGIPTIVRSLAGATGTLAITGTAQATILFTPTPTAGTDAADSSAFYAVPLNTWSPNPLRRSRFFQDVKALVDYINTTSNLITAARSSLSSGTHGGSYLPAVTGGAYGTQRDVVLYMVGGTRGISANSNWQTAFDALLNLRGNSVCALTSKDLTNEGNGSTATYASIAAMLQLHIQQRNNGIIKNEASGYIGNGGTKAQLIAQGRAFNTPDLYVFGQGLTYLDVDGNLTTQASWAQAACAAGMAAGSIEVGTPLTKKALRVAAVVTDTSWDPNNTQDINDLTAAGVMFASDTSLVGGVGIRWNRDRTTYVNAGGSDIQYDGNMWREGQFLIYDFRKRMEDRFVGKKEAGGTDNAPPTIAGISNAAYDFLDLYRAPPYRILTASVDPDNPAVTIKRGFDRVAVRSVGNTTKVSARCFLAPGIVFLITDMSLSIPTISA